MVTMIDDSIFSHNLMPCDPHTENRTQWPSKWNAPNFRQQKIFHRLSKNFRRISTSKWSSFVREAQVSTEVGLGAAAGGRSISIDRKEERYLWMKWGWGMLTTSLSNARRAVPRRSTGHRYLWIAVFFFFFLSFSPDFLAVCLRLSLPFFSSPFSSLFCKTGLDEDGHIYWNRGTLGLRTGFSNAPSNKIAQLNHQVSPRKHGIIWTTGCNSRCSWVFLSADGQMQVYPL